MNARAARLIGKFARAVSRDPVKLREFYLRLPRIKRVIFLGELEGALMQLQIVAKEKERLETKKRQEEFAKVLQI